ncbi:MAG: DNA repair exonuclease [Bacillota bacterium]|nr:DNA repair exonuclease [Bacillota bacterium]
MLTFLHAADLHLDSPFRALSPERAAERREEQRRLLSRLAGTAQEAGADLIFLSGDLFDSRRARPETLQALYQALEELEAEVFLAPGNHDPWSAASPYGKLTWPDHVHIFSTPETQRVELPHLGAVVYGSAFTALYRMDGPLEGFRADDPGLVKFGCFHGDPSNAHSRYGPITTNQIAASGLDYLALGHIHTASGLKKAGPTWYAWPGCPEGRGFDETGDKGVYLGWAEEGRVELDFVPLATRRYLTPELDITGKDPETALRDFIAGNSPQDILRILLVGERDPENEPNLMALTGLASTYFYSASVRDGTSLSRTLWERAGEDTLTGLFLRTMRRRLEEADDDEKPGLERAVRFGLAALEGREEPQ